MSRAFSQCEKCAKWRWKKRISASGDNRLSSAQSPRR
jgi:hypothetical protein